MVASSGEFADFVPLDAEHLFRDHSKSVRHYSGISVRFSSEQVFDLLRNECSICSEIRIQKEARALTMVYWQLNELKWNGVSMTKEAKAILMNIHASRIQRIAV